MKKLLENKPALIAIIAVVLLCVLALATSGERTLTWIESTAGSIFQPIQTFSYKASEAVVDFFENLFNTTDADIENQQLKTQLAQLQQILSEYETVKEENERLKELLIFIDSYGDYQSVTAQVIGKSQSAWFDTMTINAGRNHGIEEGMPLVNAYGLVGKVTDVGATWCKVTSIIDGSMNVSVMVERTRDNGIVKGSLAVGSDGYNLELSYLPSGSDLVPGDKIVTSGLGGGSYPKAVSVGIVTEVIRRTDDSEMRNAIVEPSVDFLHLEEVMVLIEASEEE